MSNVERFEGRRHAASVLYSVAGMPAAIVEASEVVSNLRAAMNQRPGDWARGIQDVLDSVKELQPCH
ncbi:type I site-specific restriction endonuclease [Metapseudomonas resinovorans]|uniref:hypothetical protein n=1 Tax=Metapseudomonas resinovorans TaxID=53412 RepID=UPI003D1A0D98